MASPSIQAAGHRARQDLRPACAVRVHNVADWVHDVVVTNRAEKRCALAEAKKFRCEMLIKKDDKGEKRTEWKHSKACPKWEPEKKPEASKNKPGPETQGATMDDAIAALPVAS